MSKVFPDTLKRIMFAAGVKQAFLLEPTDTHGSCDNCGGVGYISFFLATMGPFDEPGVGKVISKWHDGKWWCAPSGDLHFGTVAELCPVCGGNTPKVRPVYVPMPDDVRDALNAVLNRKRIR